MTFWTDMTRRGSHAFVLALAIGATALAVGCAPGTGEGEKGQMASLGEVQDSAWTALAATRIYFGHQSVGDNIMQGVSDLVAADPKLGLRVLTAAPADSGGAFVHGMIGRNGEPALKTDDFARIVAAGEAGPVQIAIHKYCYADIIDTTDAEAVFRHYREAMQRLRAERPGVTFVHVTSPVVRVQSGPRATLKRLMGQAPGRYASNFKREVFNELMRKEYGGREPLFDLAAAESTRPDGTREVITLGGKKAYALYPGYTDDGSHLNEAGRRRVAEELLVMLSRLRPGS